MNCLFAVQLLLYSFNFIYAGENDNKNTQSNLVESTDSARTIAGENEDTQSDLVDSDDSASTENGNYDRCYESDFVDSDDCASRQDEEMADIKDFKLLMTKKSFNIQNDKMFADFVHNVIFKYWTFNGIEKKASCIIVPLSDTKELKLKWQENKPLKIIIHGWRNLDDLHVDFIKNAYLCRGDYNVVTVHWESISNQLNYFKVVSRSNKVGIVIGYFLSNLVKENLVVAENIHCIGHSIGAHVAGVSGSTFFSETQEKVSRVTGLDPASPGFKDSWFSWETTYRLDVSDADFVDVIHTAMGFTGLSIPIGHADFYPNGGVSPQPTCQHYNLYNTIACSHRIVFEYYTRSVYVPNFYESFECPSMEDFKNGKCKDNRKSFMGHDADPSIHGVFFLEFDQNEYRIKDVCTII